MRDIHADLPESRPINIGIIGVGRFAEVHLEAFRRIEAREAAKVVAVCRRDPEALEATQLRWKVPYRFSDYRDLLALEEIDAVAIVTPTESHYRIAMDAIEAGKHVLCEKPLAMTARESRRLLDEAERKGVVHAVNFNLRGRTSIGHLRHYLDNGFVGKIYHINIWWGISLQFDVRPEISSWRYRREAGGGVIHELVHVFDFARFLAGEVRRICSLASISEPLRQFCDTAGETEICVADSCAHLLEFENGATGVIHTSFVSRGLNEEGRSEPRVEVSGSVGRIESLDGRRLRGVSGAQDALKELATESLPSYPQPCEDFVRAISEGGYVRTSFKEGYKAAELVDAAHLSVVKNRWVSLSEVAAE